MAYETLGSRDVERFLAEFHDIAPDQQSAYAGRLKHLSRQGFPPGVGAGRGTPAQYDADQFFQMVTVAELGQFGVPPARAIRLVTEAWPRLRETVLQVWLAIDASQRSGMPAEVEPAFWRVPAEALRDMARRDRGYSPDSSDTLVAMTPDEVDAVMKGGGYNVRRQAFVVAHQLIQDVLQQLRFGHLGMPFDRLAAFMRPMLLPPTVEV